MVDGVYARKVRQIAWLGPLKLAKYSSRRLAAALGCPLSIEDEAIEVPLPSDSYGFPPVFPLVSNIKIAQLTGRIMRGEKLSSCCRI